ncbi:hypothetical protein FHW84_000652 [Dyella sp. SG562]|uniref:DUF3247 family protein n=1 Tax=Dyella TaxID=231454 RepID=UPI00141FBD84|nr:MULTISPECIES: DUF3247 family protein [unclassified Dyella]NII72096.1 hypothetical protein [Dyella sp. SG562]NKJ23197.1 hypothetical protein [Dyella sp. SG609]
MARSAEHVYTDEPTILALEALVRELPTNGRVRLELTNGDRCEGVIVERPNVQLYLDPSDRREGINGELRLERPEAPDWQRRVWLDEIARVEHLDSTMGSEC